MIQYLRRLSRFESPTTLDWCVYFGLFTILHIPGILNFYGNNGDHNAYLMFTQSLLKGNLHLPAMTNYEDMILYHGQHYLPYPPFPSIILMPFVAVFGVQHVNTVFLVIIMSCLNLYLLYHILLKAQIQQKYFPWLIAAFFLGTGYWYVLFTSHHVYAFAQITSCSLQLLMLNEILGKKRWWLIGIFIGCSFLTRQFTVLYVIFVLGYMFYLHQQKKENFHFTSFISLLVPLGFFVSIYLLYNYVRFGNPFNPGYVYIQYLGILKERIELYGVFSTRYFLFNAYSFFIKGFDIEFTGAGLMQIKDMDMWGTSVLSASPFLIASIKAKWPKILLVASWLTIGCMLAGILCYHGNGFHQVNTMRFSLDFLPLLFLLTAFGLKSLPDWLLKGLIGYSVFLNLLSFVIHFFYQSK